MSLNTQNASPRWSAKYDSYTCANGVVCKISSRSFISYQAPEKIPHLVVSDSRLSRNAESVIKLSEKAKEITLPRSAKIVEQLAAHNHRALESVVFNEGLEEIADALAFSGTGLRKLRFP